MNKCNDTIWPGILGTGDHQSLKNGGFRLCSGKQLILSVPQNWSGRLWGRQGCSFDEKAGKGSCQTGDCGGLLQCKGLGVKPPATLVEMTFGTHKSPLHYYDVSLVDGFNLPVSMIPVDGCGDGGGGGCGMAACETDLNFCCPWNLAVRKGGRVVGCKSACLASQSARYCCTGEFANAATCKPSVYAHLFKAFCPRAYSFAYDDATGLKNCMASAYQITFCPPK